jgi:hypothetical protein
MISRIKKKTNVQLSERQNIISSVFQIVVGVLSNSAGRRYTLTCGYESFILAGRGVERIFSNFRMFLSQNAKKKRKIVNLKSKIGNLYTLK